jgi:hypothetical protein
MDGQGPFLVEGAALPPFAAAAPMSALGQKRDMVSCLRDVRFTPESGH